MIATELEVRNSGLLSTIQDLGRFGRTHLGISPGGAADPLALRTGNLLVGNHPTAAAIEMTLVGGDFRFHRDAWAALTGGDCRPRVDGHPIIMWYSFPMRAGETLSTSSIEAGARSYLCVHGGIETETALGSRSTFVSGRWGGHEGRALASGDRLRIGAALSEAPAYRRAMTALRELYRDHGRLRVTRGPQWDWFGEDDRRRFFETDFAVTSEANRNGIRLSGPTISTSGPKRELVTAGVTAGTIQITSGGSPLILFCEQQTTGGYPWFASVIRADLFRLGQLRPGASVGFEEVTLEKAWRLNLDREELCRKAVYRV